MIKSKRWFILAVIIVLSALFAGCGGGGGSGNSVPVSGNSLSGSVVLPADTAPTMTVSLLADAKYAGLTIHLFDLSEKDIVSPAALSSSGEFYFSNVPAGKNYKLVVVTPGDKRLLRKHIDSFSETHPSITVNTETTALAILVQKSGYAKSEASLAAEIPQADLTKVADKIIEWLKGVSTSSETDVFDAITDVVGEQELLEIIDDDSDEQPLPQAPAGVTAKKGSEKNIITWESVSSATSYNIYFATTSGVTRANGQKITNAVSPFNHTQLMGGIAYYYVVTANNGKGESPESVEVTATPDKTDYAPGSVLAPNTISTLSNPASVYDYGSNAEKVSIKIPVEHGVDVNYALVVLNSSNNTQSIQLKPESWVFADSDQEYASANESIRLSRQISAYSGSMMDEARINQYPFEMQMRKEFIESLRQASINGALRSSILRASDHSAEQVGDVVKLNIIVSYMFSQSYQERSCKLVRMPVNGHCKIFVDQNPYDGLSAVEGQYAITEADLDHFVSEFETYIYPLMNGQYGKVYDLDGDGRLSIVFSPVYPKVGFAGLFNTLHMNPTNPESSNQRDMLGIWSPHSLSNSTSTGEKWRMDSRETIAHEMQHAINFSAKVFPNDVFRFPDDSNFNANEESYLEAMWLDESLSVGAEARYRLARGQSSVYEARFDSWAKSSPHTYGLTSWTGVLGHYGQKGLFNYYLFEQYGSEKIKAMVQNTSTGIDNIEAISGRTIRELAKSFSLAIINENLRHEGLTCVGSVASAYKFSQPIDLDLAEQVVTLGYTPVSLSVPAMGTAYYLIKQPAAFAGGDEFQFRIESTEGQPIDVLIMRLPNP